MDENESIRDVDDEHVSVGLMETGGVENWLQEILLPNEQVEWRQNVGRRKLLELLGDSPILIFVLLAGLVFSVMLGIMAFGTLPDRLYLNEMLLPLYVCGGFALEAFGVLIWVVWRNPELTLLVTNLRLITVSRRRTSTTTESLPLLLRPAFVTGYQQRVFFMVPQRGPHDPLRYIKFCGVRDVVGLAQCTERLQRAAEQAVARAQIRTEAHESTETDTSAWSPAFNELLDRYLSLSPNARALWTYRPPRWQYWRMFMLFVLFAWLFFVPFWILFHLTQNETFPKLMDVLYFITYRLVFDLLAFGGIFFFFVAMADSWDKAVVLTSEAFVYLNSGRPRFTGGQLCFSNLTEARLDYDLFPFKCSFKRDGFGNFHWMPFAPDLPNFAPMYRYVVSKSITTPDPLTAASRPSAASVADTNSNSHVLRE